MNALPAQDLHRVLVIDDDVDLLMLLERCLAKAGYAVETAASLAEAADIIPFFQPHLVLSDINVNGQDGRQLCWKLKHTPLTAGTKVLLMSGYDCSSTRAALFGADGVIAKPAPAEYLLQCIGQQLRSVRLPQKQ